MLLNNDRILKLIDEIDETINLFFTDFIRSEINFIIKGSIAKKTKNEKDLKSLKEVMISRKEYIFSFKKVINSLTEERFFLKTLLKK